MIKSRGDGRRDDAEKERKNETPLTVNSVRHGQKTKKLIRLQHLTFRERVRLSLKNETTGARGRRPYALLFFIIVFARGRTFTRDVDDFKSVFIECVDHIKCTYVGATTKNRAKSYNATSPSLHVDRSPQRRFKRFPGGFFNNPAAAVRH